MDPKSAAKKVLVVDDEHDIVELVRYNLAKEGFAVDEAHDGEQALEKIRAGRFDVVLLDLMLPGIQGVDLCRMVRGNAKTASLPIIMLTAKSEETDKVLGLELGADDYITKPFSPRELVARVRAVLRRAPGKGVEEEVITVGDIVINRATFRVTKKGRPLELSATEFRLLLHLAERRGKVMSRDHLLDAVWGREAYVEPRTVDVHVRRLRAQIEDDPANPVHIKTRRGIGYYMEGES